MIATILGYVFFLFVSVAIIILNKATRNTMLTISNFLIIPYVVVITVQLLTCAFLKLSPPTFECWVYYALFFGVTYVFDYLGFYCMKKKTLNLHLTSQKQSFCISYNTCITVICVLGFSFSILHLLSIMSKMPNIYYIVQEEVQSIYATGFNFYIRLILMIGTVYFWGCNDFNKKNCILGILCFIPNILTFVKGIIFLPCIAVLIIKMKQGRIKFSIKTLSIIVAVGVVVFFGTYLIEIGVYGTNRLKSIETYKSIGTKLLFYFISGVQSFSQNLISGTEKFAEIDNITLAPFANVLAKVGIGHSIRPNIYIVQKFWYSDVLGRDVGSNVNGYVGTLYLFNGLIMGNILNAFWSFLTSYLDSRFSKDNSFFSALSALFCSAFVLGWFDSYFSQTFWVYLIILSFIINIIANVYCGLTTHFKRYKNE